MSILPTRVALFDLKQKAYQPTGHGTEQEKRQQYTYNPDKGKHTKFIPSETVKGATNTASLTLTLS